MELHSKVGLLALVANVSIKWATANELAGLQYLVKSFIVQALGDNRVTK
jgi:hypothetical protein